MRHKFTVLALVVAIGLYLRQVNVHALELRDKIKLGESWKGEYQRRYAHEKIGQLERTSETIMLVSPFAILLMIFIAGRIAADDFCRFFYDAEHLPRAFYAGDLVIGFGLFIMMIGLAIAHFVARADDARIRAAITADELRATLGP